MAEGVLTKPEEISQLGQDVAAQTGNAYSDIGNTEIPTYPGYDAEGAGESLETNTDIKSGLDYVDEDKSTVAGQLNSLLSSESDYIKQARLQGEKQSAKRGMLNTSMAAGASQAQAIQAGLPIAQQDAETYSQAQGRQQAADYGQEQIKTEAIVSGTLAQQNAAIRDTSQSLQNKFTAGMQGASEANKVIFQDMMNSHSSFMADTEAQHQLLLQQEQVSAEKANQIAVQSSTIMQNYQISVENMLTDPDFLNLGAAAVNNGINQLQQLARNSINFVGATSGIDLTGFVDAYLADISPMG